MIELCRVNKQYSVAGGVVTGLEDVTLTLEPGDFACLRGPSGSGKTTLLLTVGGMQLAHERNRPNRRARRPLCPYFGGSGSRAPLHVGFVFQMFHLVPYLNVAENIQLGRVAQKGSEDGTEMLIDRLGLGGRRRHSPVELSVGECQRVAVARALASQPDVILADEPTGNLDAENAGIVTSALQEFCHAGGVLLLATHSQRPIGLANRLLTIESGRVQDQPAGERGGLGVFGLRIAVTMPRGAGRGTRCIASS